MSTQTRAHRRQHDVGAGGEGVADTHGAVRTDLRYACITYERGTKLTGQRVPARHGEKVGDDKVALVVIALRLIHVHPDATLQRVSDWLCKRVTMSHALSKRENKMIIKRTEIERHAGTEER